MKQILAFLRRCHSHGFGLICSLSLVITAMPALAEFETRAGAAYVIDQTTGTVLLEKNADTPLPPASMSKLM